MGRGTGGDGRARLARAGAAGAVGRVWRNGAPTKPADREADCSVPGAAAAVVEAWLVGGGLGVHGAAAAAVVEACPIGGAPGMHGAAAAVVEEPPAHRPPHSGRTAAALTPRKAHRSSGSSAAGARPPTGKTPWRQRGWSCGI